jgi:hypothetical protein
MNSTEFGDVRYKPNGYFEWGHNGSTQESQELFQTRLSQLDTASHKCASSCKLADFSVNPKSIIWSRFFCVTTKQLFQAGDLS